MSEELAEVIQTAAVAGWWTVLIGAIWMTAAWLIWMQILKSKPAWLLSLCVDGEIYHQFEHNTN